MFDIPIPSARALLILLAGALLLSFVLYQGFDWQRDRAEQAKQAERDAQASAETAIETVVTLEAAQERDRTIDEIVASAKQEIDNAPDPDAAAAAARAAICQLPDYRNTTACQLP